MRHSVLRPMELQFHFFSDSIYSIQHSWSFGGNTFNPIHDFRNRRRFHHHPRRLGDVCRCDSVTQTIHISSIGIDENILNQFLKIYPNPSTDQVSVSLQKNIFSDQLNLKVMTLQGKVIESITLKKIHHWILIQENLKKEFILSFSDQSEINFRKNWSVIKNLRPLREKKARTYFEQVRHLPPPHPDWVPVYLLYRRLSEAVMMVISAVNRQPIRSTEFPENVSKDRYPNHRVPHHNSRSGGEETMEPFLIFAFYPLSYPVRIHTEFPPHHFQSQRYVFPYWELPPQHIFSHPSIHSLHS